MAEMISYGMMMVAGLILQYLFVAWRPDYRNVELKGHTGLYNADELNGGDDLNEPQARDDNYLFILGFFLLLETYEWMQYLLELEGLQELEVKAVVEHCAPATNSMAMAKYIQFSASVEGGFAEYLRQQLIPARA